MIFYWSLFAYFALGAVLTTNRVRAEDQTKIFFLFGMLVIAAGIGLRYEVGGDWDQYEEIFSYARYSSLVEMLDFGDPAYQVINWVVARIGFEIWLVNLLCGAVFAWGLSRLAQAQPNPWLAVLVAIPYLVVVVAMGYTRQGAAIGVLMAGLASVLRGGSIFRFLAYAAIATLFHKTAIVAIPLVIFAGRRTGVLNVVGGLIGAYVLYDMFLAESVGDYVRNYVDAEYNSQGAAIRVAMSVVPAAIFFTFRRRLAFDDTANSIWRNFSLAAVFLLVALFILPSSTVIDRLAIYIIPMQVAVLPRVVKLFRGQETGNFLVLTYSFSVLFVWLNFADNAQYWLPYQIYPVF